MSGLNGVLGLSQSNSSSRPSFAGNLPLATGRGVSVPQRRRAGSPGGSATDDAVEQPEWQRLGRNRGRKAGLRLPRKLDAQAGRRPSPGRGNLRSRKQLRRGGDLLLSREEAEPLGAWARGRSSRLAVRPFVPLLLAAGRCKFHSARRLGRPGGAAAGRIPDQGKHQEGDGETRHPCRLSTTTPLPVQSPTTSPRDDAVTTREPCGRNARRSGRRVRCALPAEFCGEHRVRTDLRSSCYGREARGEAREGGSSS